MENNQYSTLSEATTDLKRRGFDHDFTVNAANRLTSSYIMGKDYGTREVKVSEFHRFEGPSDPGDTVIVYGIETDGGERGVLIDAYGANSDEQVDAFVKGLTMTH